jgi:O-antigen ligase
VLSPDEPHNDFIRILHAYGIVGLALYVSILGQFFRKAISMLRDPEVFPRCLARIVLLALVSVVLLSITTEPMRYPSAVWYLFALASALYCVERPKRLTEAMGV